MTGDRRTFGFSVFARQAGLITMIKRHFRTEASRSVGSFTRGGINSDSLRCPHPNREIQSNGRHQVEEALHSQNAVPHLKENWRPLHRKEWLALPGRRLDESKRRASSANGFETIFRGISLELDSLMMSLGLAHCFRPDRRHLTWRTEN